MRVPYIPIDYSGLGVFFEFALVCFMVLWRPCVGKACVVVIGCVEFSLVFVEFVTSFVWGIMCAQYRQQDEQWLSSVKKARTLPHKGRKLCSVVHSLAQLRSPSEFI